jgi:hypothetical protein
MMNASENSEAPMAYSRDSVVAYLEAAEKEQARIRHAIDEARGRAARARDRAGRLGVLRAESEDQSVPGQSYGRGLASVAPVPVAPVPVGTVAPVPVAPVPGGSAAPAPVPVPLAVAPVPVAPVPVAPVPVAAVPVAPVPVAAVPVASVPAEAAPDSDRAPDLWIRPVPDVPVDPFPYRSVRPMPVPDTREAAAWSSPATDEPTLPWHRNAPMERVAGD